jgi:hypothetical protein
MAEGVASMEKALEQKCHQIKETRSIVAQLLTQAACETKDSNTQVDVITTKN